IGIGRHAVIVTVRLALAVRVRVSLARRGFAAVACASAVVGVPDRAVTALVRPSVVVIVPGAGFGGRLAARRRRRRSCRTAVLSHTAPVLSLDPIAGPWRPARGSGRGEDRPARTLTQGSLTFFDAH